MREVELLGPTAWGDTCGVAQLKASAEDFQVEEVLDIALTGEGEHLWLWVEKRYLNTEEVAKRIARTIQIPLRQVSYAGLKDKLALTRQWFSIHLPGKADPDLSSLESDELHIIKTIRHQRKLQRGTHSANGFIIRLTQLEADQQALTTRLSLIAGQGVPNYFGLQRFGFDGANIVQALEWAVKQQYPEQRNMRSRLLSSARSYLFNKVLAERVTSGSWNCLMQGDILSFTESKSFFPVEQLATNDARLAELDIHPTGPLWGEGELAASAEALALEQKVLTQFSSLTQWLAIAKLRQERRILRLPVKQLTWHYSEPTVLQLAFTLPAGCFATAVVRELVSIMTTENRCTY